MILIVNMNYIEIKSNSFIFKTFFKYSAIDVAELKSQNVKSVRQLFSCLFFNYNKLPGFVLSKLICIEILFYEMLIHSFSV